MRNPGTLIGEGLATAGGAYYTIALPNMFGLGFPGTDLMSKAMRAVVRGLMGAAIYAGSRRFIPSFSSGVLNGAMLAAGGGFLLDFMGMSLIVGRGDTAENSLLPSGLAAPAAVSGYGAYTRPQLGAYAHNGRMGAYTRPQLGAWNRAGQYSRAGQFSSAGGFSGNFYKTGFYNA